MAEPFYGPVEVDLAATDNDSAYGEELSSYTESLRSSVLNYRQENGRLYQGYGDGTYLMPIDEPELCRLDLMHEMMLELMGGKLYHAPIDGSPQNILDLGTGTGIWAIDMADKFPSALVTGVDLSPSQPAFVPPNLRFIVEDIEDEWEHNSAFDFIHARYLALSIRDYPALIQRCYNHTAPGGWVEFQDWSFHQISQDGSTNGTAIEQYYRVTTEAYAKAGYTVSPGPQLAQWFYQSGFQDIHVLKYVIPMGTWPKNEHLKSIGAWNALQAQSGFEAAAIAVMTRFESWGSAQVKDLVQRTLNDVRNRSIHAIFDFYVVWGRKPG